jgi:hypothetical protein
MIHIGGSQQLVIGKDRGRHRFLIQNVQRQANGALAIFLRKECYATDQGRAELRRPGTRRWSDSYSSECALQSRASLKYNNRSAVAGLSPVRETKSLSRRTSSSCSKAVTRVRKLSKDRTLWRRTRPEAATQLFSYSEIVSLVCDVRNGERGLILFSVQNF